MTSSDCLSLDILEYPGTHFAGWQRLTNVGNIRQSGKNRVTASLLWTQGTKNNFQDKLMRKELGITLRCGNFLIKTHTDAVTWKIYIFSKDKSIQVNHTCTQIFLKIVCQLQTGLQFYLLNKICLIFGDVLRMDPLIRDPLTMMLMGVCVKKKMVQFLSRTHCVTFSKLLKLSESPFHLLQNRNTAVLCI